MPVSVAALRLLAATLGSKTISMAFLVGPIVRYPRIADGENLSKIASRASSIVSSEVGMLDRSKTTAPGLMLRKIEPVWVIAVFRGLIGDLKRFLVTEFAYDKRVEG